MESKLITTVVKRNFGDLVEWVEYKVPVRESISVLGILDYIYDHIDSTLAFYKSCRHGRCKGCWVLVNGKPVLSCEAVATDGMRISAVEKFETIRDLVVDFRRFVDLRPKEGGNR
jgi:succinate dehydrogenase / fumarate reductase, iron-sulfur subunit